MTASTTAAELVGELRRAGVTEFVLAPGSRSAPIALLLAAAEAAGDVRLHVRIDERSAGFLAVGLIRGTGLPVAVVTTSGTAAVELHPAVVEASYSGLPLIAVTADRPAELRGTGASQTIDQVGLFGSSVRAFLDIPVDAVDLSTSVAAALAESVGPTPGPVHVNVQLTPPLVPESNEYAPLLPVRQLPRHDSLDAEPIADVLARVGVKSVPERGLVLLGDTSGDVDLRSRALALASRLGWPVIAEAAGGGPGPGVLPHGPLLLAASTWTDEHLPEILLTIGTFGVSRPVLALAERVPTHICVRRSGLPADPARSAKVTLDDVPLAVDRPSGAWLAAWRAASERATTAVNAHLRRGKFSGLAVAAEVWRSAPAGAPLFVSASWSLRAVEAVAGQRVDAPLPMCNRGANGIDGLIATAWGIALGSGRSTTALLGDLAFLYDHNALLAPESEPQPDLVIVVVDNNGGGIFHQLEQGRPEYAKHFERVFGTPHDRDLTAISSAMDLPTQRVTDVSSLRTALAVARVAGGVQVIIAEVGSRVAEWTALQELHAVVAESV
jgi:2-succinyl-5-enolpyruvyl-6-hydroxy-3-cyclohexene-1-carboxylate synthase